MKRKILQIVTKINDLQDYCLQSVSLLNSSVEHKLCRSGHHDMVVGFLPMVCYAAAVHDDC